MSVQGPRAGAVVMVVPEFPSGAAALRYTYREEIGRGVRYTLAEGTICSVYLPGKLTEVWYTKSKKGWYLKITGVIKESVVRFILSFLKLYEKKTVSRDSGISWNILDKLGKGFACEDNCILQEALVDALALKITETKLSPEECGRCHRVKPYGPLCCEHEYINWKCLVVKVRHKLR